MQILQNPQCEKKTSTCRIQTVRFNSVGINRPRIFNCPPSSIRNISRYSVESFKRALDEHLKTVSDQPRVVKLIKYKLYLYFINLSETCKQVSPRYRPSKRNKHGQASTTKLYIMFPPCSLGFHFELSKIEIIIFLILKFTVKKFMTFQTNNFFLY